jgi:SAM-dependent methyltransferase
MGRVSYVAWNVAKNVAAPVVLPRIRSRGCLGMDGDPGRVLETLRWMAGGLGALGTPVAAKRVVELGSGRTPELLGAFVLAGAASATGFDVDVQVPADAGDPARYRALAEAMAGDDDVLGALATDSAQVARRMDELAGGRWPAQFASFDGERLPLPDRSADLVVSKSVMEHVPAGQVGALLADVRRVLAPGGAMVHVIDLRDHMWIVDDDVETGNWLDALSYSERVFDAMFSGRSTYINRLRAHEWRALVDGLGFEVLHWSERTLPLPSGFSRDRLNARWRGASDEQLRVGHVCLAARRS